MRAAAPPRPNPDPDPRLVEEAAEFGNPIVRRAYGNWNMSGMQALQGQLVTNGFQLIHVPYPIPKKSAADIAMVVDVMATQARMKDLTSFVLATGDSDFSHLFCHLRQDGRRVVGFGPRSALSEIVKNSVDRYIYTCNTVEVIAGEDDHRWLMGRGSQVEPMEDAVALVEQALVNVEKDGQLPSDGMVNASQLKP